MISVGVGAAVLSAVLAVFLVKCYLNWKRQSRKKKQQSSSTADGTVQQLVLSSQPVDFVPLLIQDQLEEEENEIEGPANAFVSGTSSEDINFNQKTSQADEKVRNTLSMVAFCKVLQTVAVIKLRNNTCIFRFIQS